MKDVRSKSRKIDHFPLPTKCPHWLNPFPLCPCRHIINFEKSNVFAPKSVDVHI